GLHADEAFGLFVFMGVLAGVVLVASLAVPWHSGIAWSVGLLGADYLASLYLGATGVDGWAALYGAGLLLVAELGYWSIELRGPWRRDPGVLLRRAGWIVAVAVASASLSAILLLVNVIPLAGSLWLAAAGSGAAVAAVALTAVLAWLPLRR
ncbi:MAG: hypothetical protein ACYDAG_02395, partial [Chloroflexota bacterium]